MKVLTKLATIVLSVFLCSVAFNGFFIPNNLLSGGAGGLAIMIHYLTDLPTGLLVFLLNIPIFIVGLRVIDKKFVIYSFVAMVSMSFLLSATEDVYKYIQINDLLLESMLGGVLNGVGMGLLFRNKSSQGGFDIIAAVVKKKFNINIGTALLGVNIVIIGFSSILFGVRLALYTMLGLYISYQLVDKVQTGLDTKKTVIIISEKPQEMANVIINKLKRGATFLNGEGAYSNDNKKIIYCTVMSTQVGKLKDIVEEVDSNAFITINDTEEVKGRGFKNIGI
ncbi:MAG: YitT family protein [Firmicutes bacterium]|nr:YitT family protein [Bacillota bacterium]